MIKLNLAYPEPIHPELTYPRSHMTIIGALNAITVIIGLIIAATPFFRGWFPGALDTTIHVALGMLIFAPALFRVLVAYGSIWVDVVEIALGIIVATLPLGMHMLYSPRYTNAHMAAGGIVIAVAIISALLTAATLKKMASAHSL